MITISTKELNKFITKCADVPDTRLLPIYSYVKLECSKNGSRLIKHNGNRFLVFDVDAEFKNEQTLMIEAKPLFGFAKFSRAAEIKIIVDEKKITLDDGEKSISCQTTQDLYPTIVDNSKVAKIEMSPSVKEALGIARNHVLVASDKTVRFWNCYVYIRKIEGKYYVIGTRGEVTYFKGFKEQLPEMAFEPEVITALGDLKQCYYSSVGSYDYFEIPGLQYGFLKPETKCSEQVDRVLQNFKSESSFEIDKQPIIDFCEMVNAVNDTSVPPEIKFEGKDKKSVTIRFTEISDNVKAEEKISVTKKTFEFDECFFLSRNLLTVLKGVKSDKIKISYAHRNFIITNGEEDYIGAIMELAKI